MAACCKLFGLIASVIFNRGTHKQKYLLTQLTNKYVGENIKTYRHDTPTHYFQPVLEK